MNRDGDDVAYMRDNPKTLNRSGVYIYNKHRIIQMRTEYFKIPDSVNKINM